MKQKIFKILIEILFWLFFIGLLVCAILNVVIYDQYFKNIFGYITTFLTILNAPITFLKIKSTLLTLSLEKREKRAFNAFKEQMHKKHLALLKTRLNAINTRKNLSLNERVNHLCEIHNKPLSGIHKMDVANIVERYEKRVINKNLFINELNHTLNDYGIKILPIHLKKFLKI